MPENYPETQALVNLLKGANRAATRDGFFGGRRAFSPVLNALEVQVRAELRATEDAEAVEDHIEVRHRWERIRGKYKAAIKQIDAIQDATRRLNKVLQEVGPLVDEQVARAIDMAGYDDPSA